jgi:hypothetical protein
MGYPLQTDNYSSRLATLRDVIAANYSDLHGIPLKTATGAAVPDLPP